MVNLGIIVAVSENGVIGKNGGLPWGPIPGDLKRFQRLTLNKPIIMGRKTYESLPEKFRPLKNRFNVVVTRQDFQGVCVVSSLDEAIEKIEEQKESYEEAYLIGGRRIYEEGFLRPELKFIDLTRVHQVVEGDVHFPKLNFDEWNETFNDPHEGYTFLRYERR